MGLAINQATISNGLLPHLCSGPAVFGLVIAGELVALALVLSNNALTSFSWIQLGYVSMVVQWIVLLSALVLCQLSRIFVQFSAVVGGCLAYATVLLISLVVIGVAQRVVYASVDPLHLAKNMLLTAIFSGIFLRYLFLQQQLRNQQQAELQSRIQALHARIRPHFLFNSMNAVASLIPVNPELAEQVVEDLSQLFRVSLQEASLVSVDEEIALCRSYVAIEQIRLGDRLQVVWRCHHHLADDETSNAADILVPSLVLQPLIENAIYHGVQRLLDGGLISISTWIDGKQLILKVTNPLPVLEDNQTDNLENLLKDTFLQDKKNNRMALQNIENRLQAHYGRGASLDVQQNISGTNAPHYEVSIAIPIENDPLERKI
ncbi:MAG: two-component system sensor histidine kinase AlgZ [Kiritimatiellia bacterium]|jgi:two-component system sensor histidine kinase AlgZ